MPAPQGTPLPAHEKGVAGSGSAVWKYVKKCSSQTPNKKDTHVCVYVDTFPEDGQGAVARPCGMLVTCACNHKTFVTTGAINHMRKAHPESDIAKAEKEKEAGKAEVIEEGVKNLADAGGSALLAFSTTATGRAEGEIAMKASAACFIIYTNTAMHTLDSRYYRDNLNTHIKFTGGNPALAPITTRKNVKEYITAEWMRTWSPALPFLTSPPH